MQNTPNMFQFNVIVECGKKLNFNGKKVIIKVVMKRFYEVNHIQIGNKNNKTFLYTLKMNYILPNTVFLRISNGPQKALLNSCSVNVVCGNNFDFNGEKVIIKIVMNRFYEVNPYTNPK